LDKGALGDSSPAGEAVAPRFGRPLGVNHGGELWKDVGESVEGGEHGDTREGLRGEEVRGNGEFRILNFID
jgi:hypothetical protein